MLCLYSCLHLASEYLYLQKLKFAYFESELRKWLIPFMLFGVYAGIILFSRGFFWGVFHFCFSKLLLHSVVFVPQGFQQGNLDEAPVVPGRRHRRNQSFGDPRGCFHNANSMSLQKYPPNMIKSINPFQS